MSETLTAELAKTRTVRIFSNGDDYRDWQWNNCDRCVKQPSCDLEEIVASASVLDGLISQDAATRLGVPVTGDPRWYCLERVKIVPVPQALPGFDAVPADTTGAKPWSA